jgi:serine/threonine-protein kinase
MLTLPQATDQIGRYQILSELGRGSMGQVYLALDPNIDRHVALKVYLPLLKVGSRERYELRRRFILEAKAAGRVEHPGIVTIFDADTDLSTDLSYIAMEWVEGRSLQEVLAEDGSVPPDRTTEIVEQVAVALDAAHRQGLVHRDVKPGNILCGLDGAIKVTDFGIAKLASMSLTHTSWIPGSPFYMSPEQLRNEHVDHRSDVYSLGAVLYECLTGVVPFEGDSLASLTYMILEIDPRPPQTLDSRIDDNLSRVAMRALAKSPDERYQSALEMAQALRGIEPPRPARPNKVGPRDGSATTTMPLPVGAPGAPTRTGAATTPLPTVPAERRLPIAAWLVVLLLIAAGALALRFSGWSSNAGPAEAAAGSAAAVPTRVESPPRFSDTAATPDSGFLKVAVPSPPEVDAAEQEATPPAESKPAPSSTPAATTRSRTRPKPPAPTTTQPAPPAAATNRTASTQPAEVAAAGTGPDPSPSQDQASAPSIEQAAPEAGRGLNVDTASLAREFAASPPPVVYGTLEIVFRNRLKGGTLSVWIDDEQVWSQGFTGAKNFFKRSMGKDVWTTVRIPAGTRLIDVRLTGIEGKLDLVRQAEIQIEGGETRRVRVVYKPPKSLKLAWKDLEDG